MARIIDAISGVAGRLTAGTAMAVAILVGLYPDHSRPSDPVRIGVVITTSLAWVMAEIASGRKVSPHDIAFYEKIIELLSPATLKFLRNHDFHETFHCDRLAGLHEIAAWDGPRYKFVDHTLSRRWTKVHKEIKAASMTFVQSTSPIAGAALLSVHPAGSDKGQPEPWVINTIEELNKKASTLIQKLGAFETYARNRLGL